MLLFGPAARARVHWRLATGDQALGREALAIVDQLLSRERSPVHVLLRAAAGGAAMEHEIAWAAIADLSQTRALAPQLRMQAIAVAEKLGDADRHPAIMRRLVPPPTPKANRG